jgi:hypothetical protein
VPTVQVYLNAADRAWLDKQPSDFTAAALMRDAIARARRSEADCPHDHLEVVCVDCHRRRHVHPGDTLCISDGDIDAQPVDADMDIPPTGVAG